jgi:hypothetical protein
MLPYFIPMPELAISDELKDKIFSRCYNDKSIREDDCVGTEYFNRNLRLAKEVFDIEQEAIELENRFTIPRVHKSLLYYKPGDTAEIHVDAMFGRVSVMCWPIFPKVEYHPLVFWEKNDQGTPYKVTEVGLDGTPFIFNATKLHSVGINTIPRINLQVSFYEPIELIAQMIKENRLFRK